MTNQEILKHVDHTLLKPSSTWEQIKQICEDAIAYDTASICIPPSFVKRIHETYGEGLNICTVIGFPLGYNTTETKVNEAKTAVMEGAGEIDMVINIGALKDGDDSLVQAEIHQIKEAVGTKILKVIVETCYLSQDEKVKICKLVTAAGADYIKTSTGFGSAGATMADILLFKENIGPEVKIKAAGGIKTKQDMIDFLEAGCERLGTSSAINILKGEEAGGY